MKPHLEELEPRALPSTLHPPLILPLPPAQQRPPPPSDGGAVVASGYNPGFWPGCPPSVAGGIGPPPVVYPGPAPIPFHWREPHVVLFTEPLGTAGDAPSTAGPEAPEGTEGGGLYALAGALTLE